MIFSKTVSIPAIRLKACVLAVPAFSMSYMSFSTSEQWHGLEANDAK